MKALSDKFVSDIEVLDRFFAYLKADLKTLEKSTVYIEQLPNDNYTFRAKYRGLDPDLVMKRAIRAANEIDMYASPSVGNIHHNGNDFEVVVTHYSLD